jgi:hypothetical protein
MYIAMYLIVYLIIDINNVYAVNSLHLRSLNYLSL